MKAPITLVLLLWVYATRCSAAADESPVHISWLRENGAFGFPQRNAKVLCDLPSCRLSVWNNREVLLAQIVLWADGDATLGRTPDGREIGDWSELAFDVAAVGHRTANLDRNYILNPWPGAAPGMRIH